jgi:nucleoside-diphosphate-sugar epimerase
MQRVVVTGARGFLGANLAAYLAKEGHKVLSIFRNSENIADQIKEFSPTIVIHFAWDGGNSYKDVNGFQQPRNISYGTDILEITASITPRPAFIGVGSFAEYGHISTPASESQECKPVTLYGLSKLTFKNISEMICRQNDIAWTWIRPCYVYGFYDVQTRLIPTVARKCLANEDITLDSCTTRIDYLHISDFCSAMALIMSTRTRGIVNICSGTAVRVKVIVTMIRTLAKSTSVITYDPARDRISLSTYIVGDPETLKNLGWSPKMSLAEGLASLVAPKVVDSSFDHDGLHSENA